MKINTINAKKLFMFLLSLLAVLCMFSVSGIQTDAASKSYVKSLTLSKTSVSLKANKTLTVKAAVKVKGSASKYVTVKSSNTSVATVTVGKPSSGVSKITIKGKSKGTATITVTTKGKNSKKSKISKKIKVTVAYANVTGLKVSPAGATKKVGDKFTITPKVTPSAANKGVTYKSSNTAVAAVSSSGVVEAVGAGKATITVTTKGKNSSGNKISKKVTVTVENNDCEASSINISVSGGGALVQGESSAVVTFRMAEACSAVNVKLLNESGAAVYETTLTNVAKDTDTTVTWSPSAAIAAGKYKVSITAGSITTAPEDAVITLYEQVFADGNGSSSNPFLVSTYAQFCRIGGFPACCFKQTADISAEYGNSIGVFSESAPLTGVYDGNGHTISDLFIQNASVNGAALFNYIGEGGTVRNLTLNNIYTTGIREAAILVYHNSGTISNCKVTSCNANTSGNYDVHSAVLAVYNESTGKISGCAVTDSTVASAVGWQDNKIGGLVCENKGSMINSAISTSKITGSVTYGWVRAGMISSQNSGRLINCKATDCTIVTSSKNMDYSGRICSCNTGVITSCSFIDGTTSLTADVGQQNGTVQ